MASRNCFVNAVLPGQYSLLPFKTDAQGALFFVTFYLDGILGLQNHYEIVHSIFLTILKK